MVRPLLNILRDIRKILVAIALPYPVQGTYELADGSAKVRFVIGKLVAESAIASNSRKIARFGCPTESLGWVLPKMERPIGVREQIHAFCPIASHRFGYRTGAIGPRGCSRNAPNSIVELSGPWARVIAREPTGADLLPNFTTGASGT